MVLMFLTFRLGAEALDCIFGREFDAGMRGFMGVRGGGAVHVQRKSDAIGAGKVE